MSLPGWISPNAHGATLCLKVQPRASRNEVGPAVGAQLKVKVTAPPVDSAANDAVVELLAERLGCSRAAVQIIRGQASRNKVIQVHGLAGTAIAQRLAPAPG